MIGILWKWWTHTLKKYRHHSKDWLSSKEYPHPCKSRELRELSASWSEWVSPGSTQVSGQSCDSLVNTFLAGQGSLSGFIPVAAHSAQKQQGNWPVGGFISASFPPWLNIFLWMLSLPLALLFAWVVAQSVKFVSFQEVQEEKLSLLIDTSMPYIPIALDSFAFPSARLLPGDGK